MRIATVSPTTRAKEEYNTKHAQIRISAEIGFGDLKSRFRKASAVGILPSLTCSIQKI